MSKVDTNRRVIAGPLSAAEEPSEQLILLRDYVTAINCSSSPTFAKEELIKGFNDNMAAEAQRAFKLPRVSTSNFHIRRYCDSSMSTNAGNWLQKQARRVYEILRLRCTDTSNKEEYAKYRIDVKRRLNAAYKVDVVRVENYLITVIRTVSSCFREASSN